MRVIVMLFMAGSLAACREAPDRAAGDPAAGARAEGAPVSPGPDPWEAARARGIEFRALGQEPGWYLEIDEGTSMRLVYDYGEREVTTPVQAPIVEGSTTIYEATTEAHRLRVEIEDRRCSDVMSGAGFPRTVTVTIDGSTYTGCGRALSRPDARLRLPASDVLSRGGCVTAPAAATGPAGSCDVRAEVS